MSLIALKRTIRASLKLIDLLTSDWMNTWGIGHKIPRVSPLKSSNLVAIVCCHSEKPSGQLLDLIVISH
jgi:hypothetical protein